MDGLFQLLLRAAPRMEIVATGSRRIVTFEFGKTEISLPCQVEDVIQRTEVGMDCLVAWVGRCPHCQNLHKDPTCLQKHLEVMGNLRSVLGHDDFERFKAMAVGRATSLRKPCEI